MNKKILFFAIIFIASTLVVKSVSAQVNFSKNKLERFTPKTLLTDKDGDGYSIRDCNDQNNSIFPSAEEISYDGIDQNCDGSDVASEATIHLIGSPALAGVSVYADDPNQTWDDASNINLGEVNYLEDFSFNYPVNSGGHILIAGDGTTTYLNGSPMVYAYLANPASSYSLISSATITYGGVTQSCNMVYTNNTAWPSFVNFVDRGYSYYSELSIGYIDCQMP
ncbi:MAG: putative metal-binding motif-containing protein [Candidatus Uhrbacteria bacterium]